MTTATRHIAIIIVLFNPQADDIEHARRLAERYRGCIVDNSATPFTTEERIGLMHYQCNHGNRGIAEAQNIGIRQLQDDADISHFVFLDQDSRIAIDFPQQMVSAFDSAAQRHRLAVLGPQPIHKETNEAYQSAIHKDTVLDDGSFIPRREVISSGCCIARQTLTDVGLFDQALFIDDVDYEWCWRAEAKGYVCGITPRVTMRHQVGRRELHFGAYTVIISAPVRYYYQYRNYLWLLRRGYVPLQWKLAVGLKYALRFVYFPLFVRGGVERWRHMCRGISDGLRR